MPRPTILCPELIAEVEGYILGGNYVETACLAAGISKQSFYAWLQRGEDSIFREFLERVSVAFARAEVDLVAEARDRTNRNWAAAVTILERTRNSRWSARQQVEHTVTGIPGPMVPLFPTCFLQIGYECFKLDRDFMDTPPPESSRVPPWLPR